jgi:predicted acyltransferase
MSVGSAGTESKPQAPALKTAGEQKRYLALDAYRGFIMIMLVSGGFGFGALKAHPIYGKIAAQLEHVPWEGAVFWDLVQPAFMFMVGVAMPFALARRMEQGTTFREVFSHIAWRSLKLILISQILISIASGVAGFQLINVLSQIAFTYFLCFLIMQLEFRWQALTAALLLAGHWALFVLFPGPDGAFSKTDNIGALIDRAVLGFNYRGYYVTINFISSTVTTLFGAWTGTLLISERTRARKLRILAAAMVGCFAAGLALTLFNPMIKRLWTASFTFYSTGWVLLMMLAFFWLIEVLGYRKFAFPLVVVGMNSIFIYSINQVLKGWIRRAVGVFIGDFEFVGTLAPVMLSCATLLVMWYFCYWLYQRKIFFKL